MTNVTDALLRELIDEVRALPARTAAEIARLMARRPTGLTQDAADRELLGLITDATRSQFMTLRKLYAVAELNTAPSIALRTVLSSVDPLRLGQRLGRLRARGVVGFVITAEKGDRAGVAWCVRRFDVDAINTANVDAHAARRVKLRA